MAGFDRVIDSVTKDYVKAKDGVTWEKTRTARTALHHQVLDELGNWVGDPEAGSDLHKTEKKSSREAMIRMRDVLYRALDRLVEAKRIDRIAITIERDQNGRLGLAGSCHDVQEGVQEGVLPITPLLAGGV